MSLANWVKDKLQKVGTATSDQPFTGAEGYYLFLTTPGTLGTTGTTGTTDVATSPIWIPLGGTVTQVDEKASPVTITKQVQEDSSDAWQSYADAAIGQKVPYKIEVTLPGNYNAYDTFYATITDTLPKGMTLSNSEPGQKYGVKVTIDTVGGTDITSSFTVTYDDAAKKLTVSCTDTTVISDLGASNKIVVWYEAELVEVTEGDITFGGAGNENTATFTFSNDPNSNTTGTTNEVEAKLYTYQVTVDKLDKATRQTLEGAEFIIQDESGNYLRDGKWCPGRKTPRSSRPTAMAPSPASRASTRALTPSSRRRPPAVTSFRQTRTSSSRSRRPTMATATSPASPRRSSAPSSRATPRRARQIRARSTSMS